MSLVYQVDQAKITIQDPLLPASRKEENAAWGAAWQAEIAAPTPELVVESAASRVEAANAANGLLSAQEAPDARQEFLDYVDKTPEQRMRDAILQAMGLTEEALEAMPPEERRAIENTIAATIREKMFEAARKQLEKPENEPLV